MFPRARRSGKIKGLRNYFVKKKRKGTTEVSSYDEKAVSQPSLLETHYHEKPQTT